MHDSCSSICYLSSVDNRQYITRCLLCVCVFFCAIWNKNILAAENRLDFEHRILILNTLIVDGPERNYIIHNFWRRTIEYGTAADGEGTIGGGVDRPPPTSEITMLGVALSLLVICALICSVLVRLDVDVTADCRDDSEANRWIGTSSNFDNREFGSYGTSEITLCSLRRRIPYVTHFIQILYGHTYI